MSQYLYLNTISVYIAAILLGFGGPVLWTAQVFYFFLVLKISYLSNQGTFLSHNSDKVTMTRNSGIFWAILKLSGVIGNLSSFFLFRDEDLIQRHSWVNLGGILTSVTAAGMLVMLVLRPTPWIAGLHILLSQRTVR